MNGATGRGESGLLRVVAVVVVGEDIAAEVAREIAPDGVDVVGVVLGVVEFDDEGFALDAVVVPRAAVEGAGPDEVQAVEIRAGGLGEGGIGDLVAVAGEIEPEEGAELVALRGGEGGGGRPAGARGSTRGWLVVRISFGAFPGSTATARCKASRAFTKARPRSSSSARTRVPLRGPSRTSAGLVPRNDGVTATWSASKTVKLSET